MTCSYQYEAQTFALLILGTAAGDTAISVAHWDSAVFAVLDNGLFASVSPQAEIGHSVVGLKDAPAAFFCNCNRQSSQRNNAAIGSGDLCARYYGWRIGFF